MIQFTLAFLLGDLIVQQLAHLPHIFLQSSLLGSAFVFYVVFRKYSSLCLLPLACMLGLVFTCWYAHSILAFTLPKEIEGKTILITGQVASLPVWQQDGLQFHFALKKWQDGSRTQQVNTKIRLSWRHPHKSIRVGERLALWVRLKRLHSTQSWGAFDFEAWSLEKGLRAKGYVIEKQINKILKPAGFHYLINQWRQHLQDKIIAYLPHTTRAPWLMALMIGERNGIPQADWQILRNTGTNHLMAIAGLHIGILSGLVHVLMTWCWRRFPTLLLLLPAPEAGALSALFSAIFYSACAGFSLPTQRACLMLSVFILALLSRKKINPWSSWCLALLLVLLLNPLSVLSESFWLSFATIALIIYGMSGRLAVKSLWWKWGRVQLVISIGLIPLSLLFFQESSLISIVANSIAIPWLEFFILPFCFLSSIFLFISGPIAHYLLLIADQSLALLWKLLSLFAHLPHAVWQQSVSSFSILLSSIIGFILLLLPRGLKVRYLSILWLLPLFFHHPPRPLLGNFKMSLLDVGQGLALVIETKQHTLIYDTGAKYADQIDMGESIVLPYLRMRGTKHIDMLVISHGDNDHLGGAAALLNALPVKILKTSVPEQFSYPNKSYCLADESWVWDQVRFTFLHPHRDQLHLGNNSSCVLRIDNGQHQVLLTGDIEKQAEKKLLQGDQTQLAASILIAPHHGSKTSGIKEFINAVHPQFVIYATGYRNRYHFPHPSVVSLYTALGTLQLNTAETGTIEFNCDKNKKIPDISLYRVVNQRYWMAA